jgi:cysteinyl-tRNA synthetase
MILRNSLSKKHEKFEPIAEGKASIYSCGPTVYNNLHIGNLSAFIYADVLSRALKVNGYSVTHVMNITDVDDKTIRDSSRAYPDDDPMKALKKLTDTYAKVFMDDLAATGNDTNSMTFISAVDSIPEMIQLTQQLLDKDIAYIADDGVYFSITKYYQAGYTYGVLQKVATQQSQARIANDEYDKDSASDFALWKRSGSGEPSWDATFTEDLMVTEMPGRPGWHIECSAMSQKMLGLPFDIHTGGIDLKFPHHENEIAQSIGAGAEEFADYFVHNNHILVDGKKMAKSAGNFYTLRDIEEKGFSPEDFRLAVLESQYHSESHFSWDILQAAQNRLQSYKNMAAHVWQDDPDAARFAEGYYADKKQSIIEALANNLSTPQALAVISEVESDIEKFGMFSPQIDEFKDFLEFIKIALGIDLTSQPDITDTQKKLMQDRQLARENKNWEASDSIRNTLAGQGISVRDTRGMQVWARTSEK